MSRIRHQNFLKCWMTTVTHNSYSWAHLNFAKALVVWLTSKAAIEQSARGTNILGGVRHYTGIFSSWGVVDAIYSWVVVWLFIGTQKKGSGPPLCPICLTTRRTDCPRILIYRIQASCQLPLWVLDSLSVSSFLVDDFNAKSVWIKKENPIQLLNSPRGR